MPDGLTVGAALLVAGPVVVTICLSSPRFWRVWTVAREEHLALMIIAQMVARPTLGAA